MSMNRRTLAIALAASTAIIITIVIILTTGRRTDNKRAEAASRHLFTLFNFMTAEEEYRPDQESIEKYEVTQAELIRDVILEKKTVCAGEELLVTVIGRNPGGSDRNLVFRVGNVRGNPAVLRFNRPGNREFYVVARDEGSRIDFRKVEISVVECPGRALLVVEGKLAGLKPEEAEFEVTSRQGIGEHCTYEWNFGDGATASGTAPFATHSYALREQKGFQSTFTVTVTATDAAGKTAVGRCSVSFPNIHYIASMLNDHIIPAHYDRFPAVSGSSYEVPVTFRNIYGEDADFAAASVEFKPCDTSRDPVIASMNAGNLVGTTHLPAGQITSDILRIDRSTVPPSTCNLVVRFTGELGRGTAISSAIYLNIVPAGKQGDRDEPVTDRDMIEKLEKAARILGRDRPITPDDIKRLEKEGKL